MQLVDRIDMIKYIFLLSMVFFTGCSITNRNVDNKIIEEEKNFTSKEYKDISKDAILEAAKKIFIYTGNKQFRIDSYRSQVIASKTKMSHFPLYVVTFEDKWNLMIEE